MTVSIVLLLLVLAGVGGGILFRAGWHEVPADRIGLIYRRFGRNPADQFLVKTYGSAGWQAAVLPANARRWLLPLQFHVEYVPLSYVPDGTVGLVEAKAGAVRPASRRLGRHVECDYFQDGTAFLRGGGEQGRQLDVLPGGGLYSINTELFEVITVDTIGPDREDGLTAGHLKEFEILEGTTGVVIVLEGEPPSDDEDAVGRVVPGHHSFREPWAFVDNGGQRGVQAETLSGGRYGINPWFARVVPVPTRDLYLEWTKKDTKTVDDLDSALDQIVVDIEGHRLSLEMSQVLRIPASAAPRLVRRFGEHTTHPDYPAGAVAEPAPIQRFVERVLGSSVAGYFTALVAKYTILRFIEEYDEVRLELQEQVTQALNDWGVVAGQTVLAEFKPEDREINDLRREIAARRERRQILQYDRTNAQLAAEAERIRNEVEGDRQVVELRKQIELLGPTHIAMERILDRMGRMNVPQFVSGGSDDVASYILKLMPFASAQEMLKEMLEASGRRPAAGGSPQQLTGGEPQHPPPAGEDPPEDG